MTFAEYLEQNGPSIPELAEMDCQKRINKIWEAYENWFWHNNKCAMNPDAYLSAVTAFNCAWNLATEVMAFGHMMQDSRTLAEKNEIKQP